MLLMKADSDRHRDHDDGQEDRRVPAGQVEHVAAGDLDHAGLDEAGRHDEQPEDHHHGVAAEAGEGLVGRQQAGGDHGQHDAERHHVGRHAVPGEGDHGNGREW